MGIEEAVAAKVTKHSTLDGGRELVDFVRGERVGLQEADVPIWGS